MQNKESYVYDVFQSVADRYDEANARISMGQHVRWKRAAVDMLCEDLPEDAHILDVGCGTGDMLLLISQAAPDASLVGLDFSPRMLEQARKRCGEDPSIELVEGNALQLPFADGSFDRVTIAFALRNTADYRKALSEALRVLKSGGRLVCIDSFVPAIAVVRPFYHLYFSPLMPLIGGGLKNWRQYRWLSRSTQQFVSKDQLCQLMRELSYTDITSKSFMLGACSCVRGDNGQ